MTQQSFVSRREIFWNEFERMIHGGKKSLEIGAADFPRSYRELTQDLNTARAHGFDPFIIERLNSLVLEGNQLLYSKPFFSLESSFKGIAKFVVHTFPRSVRSHWRSLGAIMLIFYGTSF